MGPWVGALALAAGAAALKESGVLSDEFVDLLVDAQHNLSVTRCGAVGQEDGQGKRERERKRGRGERARTGGGDRGGAGGGRSIETCVYIFNFVLGVIVPIPTDPSASTLNTSDPLSELP